VKHGLKSRNMNGATEGSTATGTAGGGRGKIRWTKEKIRKLTARQGEKCRNNKKKRRSSSQATGQGQGADDKSGGPGDHTWGGTQAENAGSRRRKSCLERKEARKKKSKPKHLKSQGMGLQDGDTQRRGKDTRGGGKN